MGLLKKLAGEAAIYGLSSVVGRLLNYLLVPLYTAVFEPKQYGVVTELYAYVAFLNILYLYGMETAFFRFASKNDGKDYYSSSFLMVFFTSILFSLILFVFASPLVDFLEYEGKEIYIYFLASILAIDAISALPFAYLRLQGKAFKFAGIKLINISSNILLNLFFILWIPKSGFDLPFLPSYGLPDITSIFLANLIANAMTLLLLSKEVLTVQWYANVSYLKSMVKYAWPLLIIGFAGVTNEMLSRILLKYLLPDGYYGDRTNLEALGIFGACYKLSVFMTLGIQAFRYAAEPFFFNQHQDKNSPQLFSKVTDVFTLFGCWVVFAISINLDFLGTIFLRNPIYWEGLMIVPFLLFGGLFLGIYYNISIWYKLTDRTVYGAYLALFGAGITVLTNLILIPQFGYEGSAWATFITYFSMMTVSYLVGQKYFPVPYKVYETLLYITITGLLVVLYYWFPIQNQILRLFINILLIVMSGFGIFLFEKKSKFT